MQNVFMLSTLFCGILPSCSSIIHYYNRRFFLFFFIMVKESRIHKKCISSKYVHSCFNKPQPLYCTLYVYVYIHIEYSIKHHFQQYFSYIVTVVCLCVDIKLKRLMSKQYSYYLQIGMVKHLKGIRQCKFCFYQDIHSTMIKFLVSYTIVFWH